MASVYTRKKSDGGIVWYVKAKGPDGKHKAIRTTARTKAEAKGLARDLEVKWEKERHGLVASEGTFKGSLGELVKWALATHFKKLRGYWQDSIGLRPFFVKTPPGKEPSAACLLGRTHIGEVTGPMLVAHFSRLELEPSERTGRPHSPSYINRQRSRLSTVFEVAKEHGKFTGPNPVEAVKLRKLIRRAPDFLRPHEIGPLLANLPAEWRGLFAVCIYAGLRKGEAFALRKRDVDLERREIWVCRSHANDSTKGGREGEAVPIHDDLFSWLCQAIDRAEGELLFARPDGKRHEYGHNLPGILRRALVRAGIVDHYRHVCRRKTGPKTGEGDGDRCGHVEIHSEAEPRRCPACNMKLWPVGVARRIRFHDTRHTTATLALMGGAELHSVQRIMRHSDPRLTANTYAHLTAQHLRAEVNRITIAGVVAPDARAGAVDLAGRRVEERHPLRAGENAERVTRLVRAADKGREPERTIMRKVQGLRDVRVEPPVGVEPTAHALRMRNGVVQSATQGAQTFGNINLGPQGLSTDSPHLDTLGRGFVTPLVRGKSKARTGCGPKRGRPKQKKEGQPKSANIAESCLPNEPESVKFLTVKEVAARLGVSRAWVYQRIDTGALPVKRIGAMLRVSEADLAAFVAGGQG